MPKPRPVGDFFYQYVYFDLYPQPKYLQDLFSFPHSCFFGIIFLLKLQRQLTQQVVNTLYFPSQEWWFARCISHRQSVTSCPTERPASFPLLMSVVPLCLSLSIRRHSVAAFFIYTSTAWEMYLRVIKWLGLQSFSTVGIWPQSRESVLFFTPKHLFFFYSTHSWCWKPRTCQNFLLVWTAPSRTWLRWAAWWRETALNVLPLLRKRCHALLLIKVRSWPRVDLVWNSIPADRAVVFTLIPVTA